MECFYIKASEAEGHPEAWMLLLRRKDEAALELASVLAPKLEHPAVFLFPSPQSICSSKDGPEKPSAQVVPDLVNDFE